MDRQDDFWWRFALEAERVNAPLYVEFARKVREDDEMRTLAALVRPQQPQPNTLFGAVHYLMMRGEAGPALRCYYRTLGGAAPVDDGAYPAFRDFCFAHRAQLERIIATRVTNTNEVGRAAFLHAGFMELTRHAPPPLHLIEIGPSAGLNMWWDRFGYMFTRDGEMLHSGDSHAALILETCLRGTGTPPLGPSPRVGMRVGLERDPVDLTQPENRDWLRALAWPDHPARLARLEQALVATAGLAPDIRKGDAQALLPDAMAAASDDGTLCVYHTIVTYQFSTEQRQALEDMLTVAGLRRAVWHLSVEGTAELDYPLKLDLYADGTKTSRVLAHCGSQGGWMEWLGKRSG